ncbi:MAG: hypothetical protein AAGG08_01565 [Actinomycetota bacterium]
MSRPMLGRRRRNEPDDRQTDPITGLIAADAAAVAVAARVTDGSHRDHLVVVVRVADLDMIQQVYGSTQAARVQMDVSRRLRTAVAWLVSGVEGADATISRVAPGEFAVTLHAASTIDADLVERTLTIYSGRVLRLDQDRITVVYEVGAQRLDTAGGFDFADATTIARLRARRRDTRFDVVPTPANEPPELVRSS